MSVAIQNPEDEHSVLLSLGSVCSSSGSSLCSVTVCGVRLLMAKHPCPPLLQDCEDREETIVLAQPYSEAARQRILSSNSDRLKVVSGDVNTPASCRTASTPDLDVTGSPLRINFLNTMSVGDCSTSPFMITATDKQRKMGHNMTIFRGEAFDADTARGIWSELNRLLKKLPPSQPVLPVYILIDGKDCTGTVLYGLSAPGRRVHVHRTGPAPVQRLPTLQALRARAAGTATKVDTFAVAKYDIVAEALEEEDRQQEQVPFNTPAAASDAAPTTLHLHCMWPRPTALLCRPCPEVVTTLRVSVPAGDRRGLLSAELRVLKRAVAGLRTRELLWRLRSKGEPTTDDLLREMFQRYQVVTIAGVSREEEQSEHKPSTGAAAASYDFDKVITRQLNSRGHTDFVDALWVILCACESLQELRSLLQQVFCAVAASHIRPRIHVRDASQVATICRGLMRGQTSEPDLSGLQPLQMMVELGMSKIERDLSTILQAGELATSEQLAPFLSEGEAHTGMSDEPRTMTEDTVEYERCVQRLYSLQLVLHIVSCLRRHLNLQPATLAGYTVQVLQELQQDDAVVVDKAYTFSFSLPGTAIRDLLERMTPSTWQVTFSYDNSARTKNGSGKNMKPSSKSGRETSTGYRSTLHVTVSQGATVGLVPLDDDFGELTLLDLDPNDDTKHRKLHVTYVAVVEDNMF